MYELLTSLEWLAEEFPTQNQKIAVTVAASGLLLLVLVSYRRLQSWLSSRIQALYADIVTTIVLLVTSVLTLLVTIGVWGATDDISDLMSEFDIGQDVIARLAVSFILLVMTYIVWRFAKRLVHDLVASSPSVTDHQEEVSHRILQVTIWSLSFVVILSIWIDDLSGLLVGAGFLGIVVGMAARQTLGSLLAGFVLMFSRSFEIGHWVELDGREGTVTDISIFNTQIRSFDGEYIIVPNDVVTASIVTNRSKTGRLRLEVEVGVDYDVDIDQAATLARDALESVEDAMEVPEPQVITKDFGDSAVILGVRFWIEKPSARRRSIARTNAISAIKSQFADADVKIPYPQRELSEREETSGFRVADDRSASAEGERSNGSTGKPADVDEPGADEQAAATETNSAEDD
ncbi:mechanosensitive ion channel family protein [Natrialbaceae archaeon A-CW1-1]